LEARDVFAVLARNEGEKREISKEEDRITPELFQRGRSTSGEKEKGGEKGGESAPKKPSICSGSGGLS